MAFCFLHHPAVGVFLKKRTEGRKKAPRAAGGGDAGTEKADEVIKLQLRPGVFGVHVVQADVDDEDQLLHQVVENDDLVEEHQIHVLEMLRILSVQAKGRFGVLDEVVGEVPNQPAGEGRQPRDPGAFVFP